MGSITGCLNKLGKALPKEDIAQIKEAAREYTASGEPAWHAVADMLDDVIAYHNDLADQITAQGGQADSYEFVDRNKLDEVTATTERVDEVAAPEEKPRKQPDVVEANDEVKSTPKPVEPSGLSVEGITKALVDAYGSRVRKALKTGKTRIVQSESEVPDRIRNTSESLLSSDGTVQGFFDPKTQTSYLIADNLADLDVAKDVFLHEEGGHGGMKAMLGDRYSSIAQALLDLEKTGSDADRAIIGQARDRVMSADTPIGLVEEELIAYTIELAGDAKTNSSKFRKWLNSVYAVVKAWAYKRGITNLDIADLRIIAAASIGKRGKQSQGTESEANKGKWAGAGSVFSKIKGNIPIYGGLKPTIAGKEHNPNLIGYLDEINSPWIQERMGEEKLVSKEKTIEITKGEFGGFRYLLKNDAGDIVAAVQGVSKDGESIISNVFVRPDYRRKGLATKLISAVRKDKKNLYVDNNFSPSGAALIGYQNKTITIDGVERSTENSNGQPIHPTEQGIKNFWKWFGESRVVDEQGRPLVVYHGTGEDFDTFDYKKAGQGREGDRGLWGRGFYFTAVVDNANSYALRSGDGANVMPVHVSIQNPLVLKTDKGLTIRMPDGTDFRKLLKPQLDGVRIKEIAESNGNDGIIQIKPDGLIGDLVAFSPTQIKSATGNSGDFSADNDSILFSKKADPFYSALLRSVETAKGAPKKATATLWKGWLNGAQSRGEFKQSEREWLGIDAWLDSQGETTKQELAEFVKANQVRIEEKSLIENEDPSSTAEMKRALTQHNYSADYNDDAGFSLYDENGEHVSRENWPPSIEDAYLEHERGDVGGGTKFAQYQTEGGKNYREVLLTLPEIRFDESGKSSAYESSHFDEPNILVHTRINEHTDTSGNSVLLVEEVQSDWHQEGRKLGYRNAEVGEKLEAIASELKMLSGLIEELNKTHPPPFGRAASYAYYATKEGKEQKAISDRRDKLMLEESNIRLAERQSVLNAPLKKEWPLTAMKRMLRYAVDNGMDKLAWTTGDIQADRYDLSKQVESLGYQKNNDGTYAVSAQTIEFGGKMLGDALTGVQLEDQVGKDVAKRIIDNEGDIENWAANNKPRDEWRVLRGGNLRVGGEGMKGFYDKILPSELNKYIKQWGAKVGQTTLENGHTVHSIEITDAMREGVEQGQPLFSKKADDRIKQAEKNAAIRRNVIRGGLGVNGPSVLWEADDSRWEGVRGYMRKQRVNFQDKMLPVAFAQADIEAVTGDLIDDGMNVYRRENLMHGKVEDGVKTLNKDLVKPFKDDLKKAAKDGIPTGMLEDYLEARDAVGWRNKHIASINPKMQDGGAGISTADAQAFLDGKTAGLRGKKALTPEAKKVILALAKQLDAIRNQTLKSNLDYGRITQEAFDTLSQRKDYAPLRGKDGDEIGGFGAGRGFDVRSKPYKQALGRGEGNRAKNIIAEIIGDAEKAIVDGERNQVTQAFARLVLEFPNKDVWSIEPVKTEQKFSEATEEVYEAVRNINNDPNALTVWVKGKPYKIVISDARLAGAMKNLGAEQMNAVFRFFGKLNRYFSAILTRYNPSFVAINLLRDLSFGLIGITAEHGLKAGFDTATHYGSAMRALWREARGKAPKGEAGDYQNEFTKAGGRVGFKSYQNIDDLTESINLEVSSLMQIVRESSDGTMTQNAFKKAIRVYRKTAGAIKESAIVKVIDDSNDAVENSMRLAAFIAMRKSGRSIEQSAEYAKNITVNFNRRGQYTGVLNSLFLFFNAAVQGSTRVLHLLKNPKVMATMGALGGLQFVLVAAAMGLDDEDEDGVFAAEKISEYDYMRNLVFPVIGKDASGRITVRAVKVPMPYGVNFFSYTGGRLARELYSNKKADPVKLASDLGSAVIDAVSPLKFTEGMRSMLPYVVARLSAVGYNENDFGDKIRSERPYSDHPVPKAELGRSSTPLAYKLAATGLNRLGGGDSVTPPRVLQNILDVAPEDLRYLAQTFTGGLGRFADQSASVGEKALAGADIEANDVPILNRLFSNVSIDRSTYSRYKEIEEGISRERARLKDIYVNEGRQAAMNHIRATPSLDGASFHRFQTGKFENVNGEFQIKARPGSLLDSYKAAEKESAEIWESIEAVRGNDSLTTSERLKKLDALEARREKVQRAVTIKYHKVRKREGG